MLWTGLVWLRIGTGGGSCKLGNEPSGSIKCWELSNGCTTCGLPCGTRLHRVSYGPRSYQDMKVSVHLKSPCTCNANNRLSALDNLKQYRLTMYWCVCKTSV
jgi:hypothetical protein